ALADAKDLTHLEVLRNVRVGELQTRSVLKQIRQPLVPEVEFTGEGLIIGPDERIQLIHRVDIAAHRTAMRAGQQVAVHAIAVDIRGTDNDRLRQAGGVSGEQRYAESRGKLHDAVHR